MIEVLGDPNIGGLRSDSNSDQPEHTIRTGDRRVPADRAAGRHVVVYLSVTACWTRAAGCTSPQTDTVKSRPSSTAVGQRGC